MNKLALAFLLFIVFGLICLFAAPIYLSWYKPMLDGNGFAGFGYFMFSLIVAVCSLIGCVHCAFSHFQED